MLASAIALQRCVPGVDRQRENKEASWPIVDLCPFVTVAQRLTWNTAKRAVDPVRIAKTLFHAIHIFAVRMIGLEFISTYLNTWCKARNREECGCCVGLDSIMRISYACGSAKMVKKLHYGITCSQESFGACFLRTLTSLLFAVTTMSWLNVYQLAKSKGI